VSGRVPILVVGGGIGGLSTALALAKKGRSVRVIERSASLGEIGAGLQLAPNASRVLDRLGVLPRIHAHAVFPSRLLWMDAMSGRPLTSLELGAVFRERYGYPYIVMHRSDLLETLLDACRASDRVTIETGKELDRIEDLGDGARAVCKDGAAYECDALIAADGLWSTARRLLGDDSEPVCAELVAYRGTLAMNEISEHATRDAVMMWTGPNLHLVQYPIRRGELYNQVACFKSDRFQPGSDDWGTVAELESHFAPTCAEVRQAVRLVKRDRRWPLFDRPPLERWTKGCVTLLGDAAHPMLQYLAQGAAQALEDAAAIAECLAEPGRPVSAALLAYEEARLLPTARVQLTARYFGDLIHTSGVPLRVRDAMLAKRSPTQLTEVDWLYRAI
jgi:salicylate hydroxylase